ncbi:helix-turn-helix transcriptional regulator [Mycobacterium intracellulare]|uniref:helix-turn-helix transcriptional regulator n=1 Tax=Mycobacterium intracellulare TaxID=1767 RepID=UPI001CD92B31|nr:AraC family transcriptional regulator [Mycobacterium intracellulare]MDV6980173.1 AraC family transcriptional regulator [Mycobacterium intracellulare]
MCFGRWEGLTEKGRRTAIVSDTCAWTRANALHDFAVLCCPEPHLELLSDPHSFSLSQRARRMGPITFVDLIASSDASLDSGEQCSGYRVSFVRSGHLETTHRGSSLHGGPGTVAVYQPQGHAVARWTAASRMLAVKIDTDAVHDALSDALGHQVTSQPDFAQAMPTNAAPTRSWINMALTFTQQLFRPESLVNHPMVGLPIVDSLVRGFLLAADHSHREAVGADACSAPPRAIRAVIDIIEEEAHLPTTVSSLAERGHVSVRSLQQGFRSHLGVSPMTYLREVRLRRAHQTLLESDPSEVTVASIAHSWGFTHLGRFAALHADRYGEAPSATLYRSSR